MIFIEEKLRGARDALRQRYPGRRVEMVYSSYTRVADFELWPSSTFRVGAPMRDAELALEQGELVAAVLAKWQSQIDGLANELDPLRTTQKL